MEAILETKTATILQFIHGLRASLHVTAFTPTPRHFRSATVKRMLKEGLVQRSGKSIKADPNGTSPPRRLGGSAKLGTRPATRINSGPGANRSREVSRNVVAPLASKPVKASGADCAITGAREYNKLMTKTQGSRYAKRKPEGGLNSSNKLKRKVSNDFVVPVVHDSEERRRTTLGSCLACVATGALACAYQ